MAAVVEILSGSDEEELREVLGVQNQSGETPLYVAAEYGYVDLVREMIQYCDVADAGIKAKNGLDAFHIAAKQSDIGKLPMMFISLMSSFQQGICKSMLFMPPYILSP
ncbi:unnamed protein product [Linum tenue]|uniref:Uncharacterized protein n=1 Tax=Linum tenue TaxID=586396 RepID=A0AAV0N0G7_9ROSI|nr:unnamed protein product [Linum tenue]